MDDLGGLLDGPRARGAFLLHAVFAPPWSIRVEDEAPLTVVVQLQGTATFTGSEGAVPLAAGDVVLARGPAHYSLADSSGTPPDIRILPGQVCVDPHGHLLAESMTLGVRTWGNAATGDAQMLIGTYERATEVGARALSHLPSDLVVRGLDSPLVGLLAAEVSRDAPGQEAVLDRLLDLLLVTCLRHVFADSAATAPAWFSAGRDPVVGRAVQLIHHHPAHPWSLASLAAACGVSRATLARRFTRLVGEPPMSFLTGWRLAVAADLLAEGDATVGSVAQRVGYASAFALSTAFKRLHGVAPSEYRRRSAAS
ncbi:AraC family transcriptional regulator [Cellulomonas edaphi]|uniref:AraC family transcriptional regulator n=1 Tax=Cellulomonas edaphi TaxID=3053468 RepID=A0ABT7S2L0_9CELL|nr:AraC family transcriptional regulator [Cellulomons edaphi]MDM7829857.1 AraC family transcriptional regulator [Cellulomons edaphi]